MSRKFPFVMIGAMYENGGNTTHRFLDGHPQLYVYPFESQVGTRMVSDRLASVFPVKYRWPVFDLAATPEQDYHAIIDEECKVRTRTPNVSKFRHKPFDLSDDARKAAYVRHVRESGRSRGNNMQAFFRATFDVWKDFQHSGKEKIYVGYSPIIVVDADKILDDLPEAHFLHVVRNPWSAYADTKKRPVPHSLSDYMLGWTLNQHYALLYKQKYPKRMHIVRTEDTLANPFKELGGLCKKWGIDAAPTLKTPSWNGTPLNELVPWGTLRIPTSEANRSTAMELSTEEKSEIRLHASRYLDAFDYKNFLKP